MIQAVERTARIRCTQLSPVIGEFEANLDQIERELRQAVLDGIELLVLPELATSGYGMTLEEARESAISADSEIIRNWEDLLSGSNTTAVIGFNEDGGDNLYNSAVAIAPGASPIVYRKLHLWDTEQLLFAPGSAPAPILQTPVGAVAVIICYDLEFPELPRSLALAGAEIIAVPTNWPVRSKPIKEHPQEVVHAMAAAQASGIVIACCDRSGNERGTRWTHGTTVVTTEGWPSGSLDESQRLDVTVSLPPARHQISERNHLFEDRRPEFYGF